MVLVPAVTPVICTGDEASTVAIEASEVDHVPPAVVLENDVTAPTHTVLVPVIAGGALTTENERVERQVPIV